MPTAAKSQNGWPASPNASELKLTTLRLKLKNPNRQSADGTWPLTVATAAAPSFEAIIKWWDENIEPVTQLGGYNYREIRGYEGTNVVSNHGSGTAIDINWDKHPWKASGTIPADKVMALRAKAASVGLLWGGDYSRTKDEMHFEVPVTPTVWDAALATYEAAAGAVDTVVTGTKKMKWVILLALLGGGLYFARKKGYLRPIGARFPKLRRLTGA